MNSVLTPNCHRPSPEEEQGAVGRRTPQPCTHPCRPPALGALGRLIPASRKSFPPGTCGKVNTGVAEMGPSQLFCLPAPPATYRACSSRVRCFPDTRKACGNSASVSSRTCSETGGGPVRLAPPPRHCGVEADGLCPRDTSSARDQGRAKGACPSLPNPTEPSKRACAGLTLPKWC